MDVNTDKSGAQLMMTTEQRKITKDDIAKATELLKKYKDGKASLEDRIVEDEQWYKIRHWEYLRKRRKQDHPEDNAVEPSSAWLFNSIANKHADAMDNYPEPSILPRESSDEQDADTLSEIIPCVIERNNFEQVYSDAWWYKLKHGTAAYGVFWDKDAENGLGDIAIRKIDLLNIFWEPGITDIQDSKNLFIVNLVDNEDIKAMYGITDKGLGNVIEVANYLYDDSLDNSDKSLVVDWYYKTRAADGRTLLHYCKFVGSDIIFASENEPAFTEKGWYDHGDYPIVLDNMYPEEGTPYGFGLIAVCKDPQLYIDKLGANIMEHAIMAAKPRFFVKKAGAINLKQLKDWNEPLIEVSGGQLGEDILPLAVPSLDGNVVSVLQMKIDELKETSSNRDVSQGSTSGGVTAAAAIAALQEAGNKTSRDQISASYRAYTKITTMCVELIRQFYDETREFRITGQNGIGYEFIDYSNERIKDQVTGYDSSGLPMYRRPVFDIKISAQKQNPFNQLSQNESAKEMFQMGFFNPEMAQQTMVALDMMEFEGKQKVIESVQQGQTLLSIVQQMGTQLDQMAAIIQALTGKDMLGTAAGAVNGQAQVASGSSQPLKKAADGATEAATTSYGEKLASRASPDMGAGK